MLPFMALAVAAFATSCSSDNLTSDAQQTTNSEEEKKMTLTATIENDNGGTRVGMTQEGSITKFYWHKGDQILLQTKSGTSYSGTKIGTQDADGTAEATFSASMNASQTMGKYAVYPGDNGHEFTSEKELIYKLPSSYENYKPESNVFPTNSYSETSIGIPMLGTITDSKIAFKQIGGLAIIHIDKMPAASGTLTVTADQQLSGDFKIKDMSSSGVAITTATTSTDADMEVTFNFSGATKDGVGVFCLPLATGTYTNVKIVLEVNSKEQTAYYGDLLVARASVTTIPLYNNDGTINAYCKDANGDYIINGHKFIDLGLPSGLLWAETNVGAETAADYGDYFAWGETTTKETYTWDNYKYGARDDHMKKYYFTDGKIVLDAVDDAATVHWGSSCRMPTKEDLKELLDSANCTWTWSNMNNSSNSTINGYKVISTKNNNEIFLPAAGDDGSEAAQGMYGRYRSSTLSASSFYSAWCLNFDSDYYGQSQVLSRFRGYSVRPVAK